MRVRPAQRKSLSSLPSEQLPTSSATSARTGEQRAHAASLAVPSTLQSTLPQPAAAQTFSMFAMSHLMPSIILELWENNSHTLLTANQSQSAPG